MTTRKVKNLEYTVIPNPLIEVMDFLRESNAIEREYSEETLEDAIKAWEYLVAECCAPVKDMILEAHRLLMHRLRPDIAGKLRNVSVMVGGRVCPSHYKIPALLDGWSKTHALMREEESIKQAHIAFEKIHPFEDGNGRVGRLLMNLQRLKANLPLLVIHEGVEQYSYYKWFD